MGNNYSVREPFVRVTKRAELSKGKTAALYAASVLFALLLGGIFITFIGQNPIKFYSEVFLGCFKNKIYFFGLTRTIMPLLITSIGVSFAFKMKYWNIGAEGQFMIGAICATAIGLFFGESLPHGIVILFMFLAGAIGAGIYGLITAIFKVKFGTNETLLTLMLNYVAYFIAQYLTKVEGFRVEGSRPGIKVFHPNAWLDQVGGIDITIFFCIAIVIAAFIYFKYTKQGYELAIVGESQNTARYAGMSVKKVILRTMFISAAIIGLAGMFQVAGAATGHQLTVGITGGVGWTAIIVAWLAKLNPLGILAVSILMGILSKGSEVANSSLGISTSVSDILQSIILFSVLAFDFFIRYKIVLRKNKKTRPEIAVNNAYNDIDTMVPEKETKISVEEVIENDDNN